MKKYLTLLMLFPFVVFAQKKVGIGTTNPTQRLSVDSTLNIDQGNFDDGTKPSLRFGDATSGESIGSRRVAGGTNPFGLDFFTNSNKRMSITSDGKVGIGTITPFSALHTVAKTGDQVITYADGSDANFSSSYINSTNTTSYVGAGMSHQNITRGYVGINPNNDLFLARVRPSQGLQEALTISNSSGKVGIGKSNPDYALDVFDATNEAFIAHFVSSNTAASVVRIENTAGGTNTSEISLGFFRNDNFKGKLSVDGSNNLVLSTDIFSTPHIAITPTGNVGIGRTDANFPLNFTNTLGDKIALYGNTANTYGFGIQNNLLQIHTDGTGSDVAIGSGSSTAFTERMRIKGNGNIGIGTASPSAKLQLIQTGLYSHAEGNNNAFEIIDTTGTDHTLYMGADATNQLSYIQSVANGGFRNLLLQGRGGNVLVGKDGNVSLQVKGDIIADYTGANIGSINNGLRFGGSNSGEGIASKRNAGGNTNGLDFYTASNNRMSISNAGQITIPGNLLLNGTLNNYQAFVSDISGQRQKIITGDAGLSSPGGGAAAGFIGTGTYVLSAGIFTSKPYALVADFTSTSGDCKKVLVTTEVVANGGGWTINLHVTNSSTGVINFGGTWRLMIMGGY